MRGLQGMEGNDIEMKKEYCRVFSVLSNLVRRVDEAYRRCFDVDASVTRRSGERMAEWIIGDSGMRRFGGDMDEVSCEVDLHERSTPKQQPPGCFKL